MGNTVFHLVNVLEDNKTIKKCNKMYDFNKKTNFIYTQRNKIKKIINKSVTNIINTLFRSQHFLRFHPFIKLFFGEYSQFNGGRF